MRVSVFLCGKGKYNDIYSRYLIALGWLLAMWVLILICMVRFYRIRRAADLMTGALLLWTTFAAYLNFGCYVMSINSALFAG